MMGEKATDEYLKMTLCTGVILSPAILGILYLIVIEFFTLLY